MLSFGNNETNASLNGPLCRSTRVRSIALQVGSPKSVRARPESGDVRTAMPTAFDPDAEGGAPPPSADRAVAPASDSMFAMASTT